MKKCWLVLILFVFCVNYIFTQNSVSLDVAIEDAANFLNERIPTGTSVAVFNFSSDSEKLSLFIVDELTIALANTGMDVFDRNNLDEVNREIFHGFTGAVNDDTAQSYGKDIGVQTVILGSITKSGDNEYRLRVQAIIVETKRVQAGRTFSIIQNDRILSLLDITIKNEYRFTSAEKLNAGFKNMLFGWGSFQMGDPFGGASTLVLETGSLVVFFIGLFTDINVEPESISKRQFTVNYNHPNAVHDLEWSNGVGTAFYYDGVKYLAAVREANVAAEEEQAKLEKVRNSFLIGGGIGFVVSITWGFIRPYMYDKPVAVQKVVNVIDHLHFRIMPMSNGNTRFNVTYRYSF